MQWKLLGIISVDFDVTGQLLVVYSAFVKYLKKWEYNEAVHQLFIDFKKAYDSVRREVLYNILIEFGTPMKLVRLIKILCGDGFMDFIHRPKSKILKIKIIAFRKLALLPSSGEWWGRRQEHLLCGAP
jgi:hypothetical protein